MFAAAPGVTDIEALLDVVDGIVLTGARANVHPTRFNAEPHPSHEPYDIARDDVASGALVRVLPRWSAPRATLSLVHPAARHVPLKVIAFRDFVLAHAAATSLGSAVADS